MPMVLLSVQGQALLMFCLCDVQPMGVGGVSSVPVQEQEGVNMETPGSQWVQIWMWDKSRSFS